MTSDRPRILVDALAVSNGGGHSYAVNLIRELDRDDRGFEFTILVPPGALSGIQTTNVVLRPVALPDFNVAIRILSRFIYEEFVLPFSALRFDAVYSIADLASPFLPRPTVVALRNLNIYDHTYYNTFRLRVMERLVRLGIRRARRMIFPSHAAARLISEKLDLPKHVVRVVPHGVDAEAFTEVSGKKGGTPFLFLPAAVERHKNLEVLIDAIRHFSDSKIEIRIAGPRTTDPIYEDQILERARHAGVEDRFHLLGPVPYEQIVTYYRGALALVFPSFLETFGHPMLEAMLAATPIVASDIPAFQEVGKDVALFFPPDDPIALAECVNRLIAESTSTAARVSKGQERAAAYSWKNSTDTLCAVLEEAIGEARK